MTIHFTWHGCQTVLGSALVAAFVVAALYSLWLIWNGR